MAFLPTLHTLALLAALQISTVAAETISIQSTGNPILADGSHYSADPGPLVVGDKFYIMSGEDVSAPTEGGFNIQNWLLFATEKPDPSGANWTINTDFLRPEELYKWAQTGSAYASQIVKGADGRFYVYTPVTQKDASGDPFGIGVAVADQVEGPYTDHHPSGPIVSQSYPAPGNTIQNIDPTVLVDDDGRVYMYWGTFGALKGVELADDMATFVSDVVDVTSLTGFFEAPWLMKRGEVYYLLYADNQVGADSPCTPTSYHACIAYGTSSSPLGPWTYQDVILGLVSSTTSHPGAVEFKGQWYLVYHTADAKDGGHFRRSVALDIMEFDDSQSPPTIKLVQQTHHPSEPQATRNRQQLASVVSDPAIPVQYWVEAVHDQILRQAILPPDYWGTYNGENSVQQATLTYSWEESQSLNGTSMVFFADQPAGAVIGVAPPVSWSVEYLDLNGQWTAVANHIDYPLSVTDTPQEVPFDQIETQGLRATLRASTDGRSTAGMGVQEWYTFATKAEIVS